MAKTLKDWSIISASMDPYMPPELAGIKVFGTLPSGKKVVTSRVVSVDGRLFTTRSGHVYRLGRISPSYRQWLAKNGRAYDPDRPITECG